MARRQQLSEAMSHPLALSPHLAHPRARKRPSSRFPSSRFPAMPSASPPPDPLDAFLTKVIKETRLEAPAYTSPFRYHPDGWILPSPAAAARLAYRATLDEDSCMSFDEWKAAGYFIKKGSKSHFQDALGIPQFTKEQVEKSTWRR